MPRRNFRLNRATVKPNCECRSVNIPTLAGLCNLSATRPISYFAAPANPLCAVEPRLAPGHYLSVVGKRFDVQCWPWGTSTSLQWNQTMLLRRAQLAFRPQSIESMRQIFRCLGGLDHVIY